MIILILILDLFLKISICVNTKIKIYLDNKHGAFHLLKFLTLQIMNVLQYEKAKLEVLKSSDIVLFSNSIECEEEMKGRITVKMNYAETDFVVLIFLTSPLDFIIRTPELLPADYLRTKKFCPATLNSLPSLLSRLTSELKNYNRGRHDNMNNIISDLCDAKVLEEDNYELLVRDSKASLYLKFPITDLDLVSFMESVSNDRLINSSDHHVILKIVETGAKGSLDFSLTYSSGLLRMLPGLKSSPVEMKQSDIVSMVSSLKENLTEKINDLHRDWKARASFLLPLYQAFNEDGGEVRIDFETMTELQLGFVFESKKALLEISLPKKSPSPKVCLTIKTATSRAKKHDLTREITPGLVSEVEQFHGELLNILQNYLTTE